MELTPAEGRVLGCLIEKQVDGPDAYALTLNELRFACNQTIGRSPVVTYDDRMIEETLTSLKSKGLARFVPAVSTFRTSGRSSVPNRCRHRADERWRLSSSELTVLAALLLRGPQTTEEIRAVVTDHPLLETTSEVDAVLDALAGRTPTAFATRLKAAGSTGAVRWAEVLTGWPEPDEVADMPPAESAGSAGPAGSVHPGAPGHAGDPFRPRHPVDRGDPAEDVTEQLPLQPGLAGTPAPSPLTMVELADRLSNIERRLAGIEVALTALRKAVEGQPGGVPDQPASSRLRT